MEHKAARGGRRALDGRGVGPMTPGGGNLFFHRDAIVRASGISETVTLITSTLLTRPISGNRDIIV